MFEGPAGACNPIELTSISRGWWMPVKHEGSRTRWHGADPGCGDATKCRWIGRAVNRITATTAYRQKNRASERWARKIRCMALYFSEALREQVYSFFRATSLGSPVEVNEQLYTRAQRNWIKFTILYIPIQGISRIFYLASFPCKLDSEQYQRIFLWWENISLNYSPIFVSLLSLRLMQGIPGISIGALFPALVSAADYKSCGYIDKGRKKMRNIN